MSLNDHPILASIWHLCAPWLSLSYVSPWIEARIVLINPILILPCIDDFQARSSDELTLHKGDRVELTERDDEFGDGWFLGRHLVNGNSGLFPEGMSQDFPSALILTNS